MNVLSVSASKHIGTTRRPVCASMLREPVIAEPDLVEAADTNRPASRPAGNSLIAAEHGAEIGRISGRSEDVPDGRTLATTRAPAGRAQDDERRAPTERAASLASELPHRPTATAATGVAITAIPAKNR